MEQERQAAEARKAIREALVFAHKHLYTTNGQAWRQIIPLIELPVILIAYITDASFVEVRLLYFYGDLTKC